MSEDDLLKMLEMFTGRAEGAGGGAVAWDPADRWTAHEAEQALALRGDRVGTELEPGGDVEAALGTVTLEKGMFKGRALPLYQMPGVSVLEIMLVPYEPVKMYKMVGLLQTALESDKDVEMLNLLSMRDLMAVLNQWVDKSNEKEETL